MENEEDGGMSWEIRIDICVLPCVELWKATREHRKLSLVLCGDPGGGVRGRKFKPEGIYIYIWLIHFIAQQRLMQHCKPTIPQFFFLSNISILDGGDIMVTTNILTNTF